MENFKRKQAGSTTKDEVLFMSAPNLVFQACQVDYQSKQTVHKHNGKKVNNNFIQCVIQARVH